MRLKPLAPSIPQREAGYFPEHDAWSVRPLSRVQAPRDPCCQLCGCLARTLTVIMAPFAVAANAARACASAARGFAACSTKSTAPVRTCAFPAASTTVVSNSMVTRNVSIHRPSVLRVGRSVCGQQHPQRSTTTSHRLVGVIVAYCRHAHEGGSSINGSGYRPGCSNSNTDAVVAVGCSSNMTTGLR
jgi:hypothetical protein